MQDLWNNWEKLKRTEIKGIWNICSEFGRLNTVKMQILFHLDLWISCNLKQISIVFSSHGAEKLMLQFLWKCKFPRIAKILLKKNMWGIILSDIKAYYKALIIKTVWCWHKDFFKAPWNMIVSLETKMSLITKWFVIIDDKGSTVEWWRQCGFSNKRH